MARIYTEIRITHESEEEKKLFDSKLETQAAKMGINKTDYIRLIVNLDTATGILEKLKK